VLAVNDCTGFVPLGTVFFLLRIEVVIGGESDGIDVREICVSAFGAFLSALAIDVHSSSVHFFAGRSVFANCGE
jgi:hypothetical protein